MSRSKRGKKKSKSKQAPNTSELEKNAGSKNDGQVSPLKTPEIIQTRTSEISPEVKESAEIKDDPAPPPPPETRAQGGSGNQGQSQMPSTSGAAAAAANDDHELEGIVQRWNGTRVADISKFLSSRHASPVSLDDSACAVYAMPEVKEMFLKVLPFEAASILWYNKSRKSARICPACRRFYLVEDILLPHVMDQRNFREEQMNPRNVREKQISGLCSLMCFGIASYNWPGCIGAWGNWMSQIDSSTLLIMQGIGSNIADEGMSAFMKLSRDDNLLGVLEMCCANGYTLYP